MWCAVPECESRRRPWQPTKMDESRVNAGNVRINVGRVSLGKARQFGTYPFSKQPPWPEISQDSIKVWPPAARAGSPLAFRLGFPSLQDLPEPFIRLRYIVPIILGRILQVRLGAVQQIQIRHGVVVLTINYQCPVQA